MSEEGYIEITCMPEAFSTLREYIESANILPIEADIRYIATMKKELTDEEETKFQNFLDKLESNDDVQNVWHNADI